jgi:thioredoxin 1
MMNENEESLFVLCIAILAALCVFFMSGCDSPKEPCCPRQPSATVLHFTASWCGPCQKQKPVVESLRSRGLRIITVDIDMEPERAKELNVKAVPDYVVVIDKRIVLRTHDVTEVEQALRRRL